MTLPIATADLDSLGPLLLAAVGMAVVTWARRRRQARPPG